MTQPGSAVVVRVKFANRRQLKQAYLRDLTKGTLFVRTDTPLPLHEKVMLVLELPDGESIDLTCEVTHVVEPHAVSPSPVGMSVRLLDFSSDQRGKIEELLARARTLVPGAVPSEIMARSPSGPVLPVPAMDILVRGLRRLVWLCGDARALGEVDYYQILGLPATASTDEIREACTILRVLLEPGSPPEGLADRLTVSQRTRVTALYELVSEMERVLTNPARRAEYDAAVFSIVR